MVYLFAARLFSFRSFLFPSRPRVRSAAAREHLTRNARPDRVWNRLRESICQRLFPFRYIRIKGGVSARSFLTYSYRDTFVVSISTLPSLPRAFPEEVAPAVEYE